jgi:hypothetical protein
LIRPRARPQHDLNALERKVSSQNGEDGIIAALLDAIGTTNRYVVEFGVEDGNECNSARLLRECGWNGLLIEGDDGHFDSLERAYAASPRVHVAHHFITAENIAQILVEQGVPTDMDLLSIDLDGNDYWVWQALDGYRPRVVVIEYNAAHPPPERWVMAYDPQHVWRGDTYFGASLTSLAALGRSKGYALLATDAHGVNAFFLRRDLLELCPYPERTPEEAYHPPGYYNISGTLGHPPGDGPFVRV